MDKSITPNEPANFTPELGAYTELKPFRFWCQKVLPLVYDDSLSYYELLCKVVDFLNKAMEDVEVLHGDVTNLHEAYVQLQDYVNTYFENLDVQEEINNKLDNMVTDGTLQGLIRPIIGGSAKPVFVATKEAMTDQEKIYVLTTDGHIYNWAGSSFIDTGMIYGITELIYRPSNVSLNADNYTQFFDDINNAENGLTYFVAPNLTEDMVKNLPVYGVMGMFATINYSSINTSTGKYQIYINKRNEIFYRINTAEFGTPEWTEWVPNLNANYGSHLAVGSYGTTININTANKTINLGNTGYIFSQNQLIYLSRMTETTISYANLTIGTYVFVIRDGKLAVEGLQSIQYNLNDVIVAIIFFDVALNINWKWIVPTEVEETKYVINDDTCAIFKKIVCCGDSYTSGFINISGEPSRINEDYAWPSYLERLTGTKCVNCGNSGANSKTWQTLERGLPKAKTSGVSQAYIFWLGLNDYQEGTEQHIDVGVPSDIGTNNNTFYAQYSKCIREVKTISPEAKIFCMTIPFLIDPILPYNEAIRTICTEYNTSYDTFLIDLVNYTDLFGETSITTDNINGHYTAIGYQQFAMIIKKAFSDVINANVKRFQDVYSLPYGD